MRIDWPIWHEVSGIGQHGASDTDLADAFIAHIRALNSAMQIPTAVKGLRPSDFETIIDRAFKEAQQDL